MSLPPRANPDLLGHEAAEATLTEALSAGRLPHAWLIVGPPGIGKATLAFRLARRLLAGGGEGLAVPPGHPVFRRVAAGSHADLLTIERGWNEKLKKPRSEILVEDVRKVGAFMHLTPAEGGWRVVIVDGAEDMNRNAANALLKVLEEPPSRAVLILVAAAAGRLLPTIRSRCRRLRLAPLPDANVATLLRRFRPDLAEADRARLVAIAAGSPGQALALAEADGVALAGMAEHALIDPERLDVADANRVFEELGRDEAAFSTFMAFLRDNLSSAVRHAARDGDTWRGRPLADWVAVWQTLGAMQDEAAGLHLDKRETLVQAFATLSGKAAPEDWFKLL